MMCVSGYVYVCTLMQWFKSWSYQVHLLIVNPRAEHPAHCDGKVFISNSPHCLHTENCVASLLPCLFKVY